jgi:hypothetical protein
MSVFHLVPNSLSQGGGPALRRGLRSFLRHSVLLRLLIFALALYEIGVHARPWKLGWLRDDEAAEIAETFIVRQGAELGDYTLIQAVERRRHGEWSARAGEERFSVDPAVGYVMRYFRPGAVDGWTVAVAPSGRIYRVQREQLDDEPGVRLDRMHAFNLVLEKLATELTIPAYTLKLLSDTMLFQPQRNDWSFAFAWPEVLGDSGTLHATLAGQALTDLAYRPQVAAHETMPNRRPRDSRVLGFALILGGVFLIMHYHRTPLALKSAGRWGTLVFFLVLAVRGLTFSQAVIFMPADSPLTGYLSRMALSALIEALQTGLLLGLVVATGEALSRDVFRTSSSLSRLPPGVKGWRAAWAQAARWAFPAAAAVLLMEAAVTHWVGPVGLCSKVPSMIAGALSSPSPLLALPSQIMLDLTWEECLYRLWLLSLLLFWLRLPVLAIPLAAGAAAFFAGFDLGQFLSLGGIFYCAWGLVAGFLMWRVGIVAAMLFHLFVVGGYAGLVMLWTGFGLHIGAALIGGMLAVVLIVARDRSPKPATEPSVVSAAS